MPRYFVAVCLGGKSRIDPEKLKIEFRKFLPEDELIIVPPDPKKTFAAELFLFLTDKAPDAQLRIVVEGDEQGDEPGEEILLGHIEHRGLQLGYISWSSKELEQQLVGIILVELEDTSSKMN